MNKVSILKVTGYWYLLMKTLDLPNHIGVPNGWGGQSDQGIWAGENYHTTLTDDQVNHFNAVPTSDKSTEITDETVKLFFLTTAVMFQAVVVTANLDCTVPYP